MGFTKDEIVKIYKIFNRVVDCQGNLKVFGGFDKIDADKAVIYVNKNNIKEKELAQTQQCAVPITFNECSANKHSSVKDPILSICVSPDNPQIFPKNFIKTFKISNTIQNKHIKECIDRHFSILLNAYGSHFSENDFEILYGAFIDILYLVGIKFDVNASNVLHGDHTMLYLNTFKNLIGYFRDGKTDIIVAKKDQYTIVNIDEDVCKKLDLAFKIRKILCRLLPKMTYIDKSLSEDEFDKILNDLAYRIQVTNNSKNTIHYGAPGTGKTRFVKEYLAVLDPSGECTEWVQFHSGYEYEDFIDGIRPVGVSGGNLQLDIVNGAFKNFCIKATENLEKPYFFIVDEINRANVSAVFGETLSLLEESYRGESNAIRTKNSVLIENDTQKAKGPSVPCEGEKSKFYIPENIYFIGMMNDVDKSIDCFDLALRRRFTWVLHECDYESLSGLDKDYITKCKNLNIYITGIDPETKKATNAETLNLGRAYEIGQSYFLKKENMDEKEIWDLHIEPILREYIRSQFGEDDIDDKLGKAEKIFVG